MRMGIIERHLRIANDLPDAFRFFRWECFPKAAERVIYFELEGGVCVPLKSGKRKGSPNYRTSTDRKCFCVTVEESDRLQLQYEQETGSCHECMGEGKTVSRVSVVDGTEYRECCRCKGSGKTTEVAT